MVGRFRAIVAAGLVVAAPACGQRSAMAAGDAIPPAPREFRGAWVATVNNIDWPSRPGLGVDRQRAELDALLDRAAELRLNALLFQVRPAGDAFYPSALAPWSEWLTGEQGRAPSPAWDPLQHAIDGAQARGLELHAWFNPFRARHRSSESELAESNFARRPGVAVRYGPELWLDPGAPEVRRHVVDVVLEVVERYDVDAVVVDDYFYPYPEGGRTFDDAASWSRYRAAGGTLSRADWRRENVDDFVATLHRAIKDVKPWVRFGISPFGIARPGVPHGIQAGLDQYADLYADVQRWMAEGWYDYLSPQLYWPIGQRPQSYATLLRWWAESNAPRHLWISNFTSQVLSNADGWSADELVRQIELTRETRGAGGNVHFSMRALRDETAQVAERLRRGPYRMPALVPASPWLDAEPPGAPSGVTVRRRGGDLEVRWQPDADARWRAVWLRCAGRWALVEAVAGRKPGILVTAEQVARLRVDAVAVASVDRCGNEGPRVVLAVPAR